MGSTHHALEDLGVLKGLPNMNLFFPCANDHVKSAVTTMNKLRGPSYLRLSISAFSSEVCFLSENTSTLTRHYHKGNSITVIGVGHAASIALAALGTARIDADVFGIARFPFDWTSDLSLKKSVERTSKVIVVEEHYLAGGMAESLKYGLPNTQHFSTLSARYF